MGQYIDMSGGSSVMVCYFLYRCGDNGCGAPKWVYFVVEHIG